jgi:phosphotransferase system HPr-like phosphotransfer protein
VCYWIINVGRNILMVVNNNQNKTEKSPTGVVGVGLRHRDALAVSADTNAKPPPIFCLWNWWGSIGNVRALGARTAHQFTQNSSKFETKSRNFAVLLLAPHPHSRTRHLAVLIQAATMENDRGEIVDL